MTGSRLVPELPWIWSAVAALVIALCGSMRAVQGGSRPVVRPGPERLVLIMMTIAIGLMVIGLAARWQRLGHGPFISMFEVLASSIASLALLYAIVYWRMASLRATSIIVLPVLAMMSVWMLVTSAGDTHLPPTYDTPLLWMHLTAGKLFLGCALIATGIAGALLTRARQRPARFLRALPSGAALEVLAWKFMLAALVFETFMLIAGAVWAQDAWGRYWAWDPLETWAFITWIALAAAMHLRVSMRIGPRTSALLIVGVFALAFVTFFGVPFVSVAPHKGAL